MKPAWNKVKEDWDFFPDNSVRLNGHKTVAKHLDLEPAGEVKGQGATTVVFNTNLFEAPQESKSHLGYEVDLATDVTPTEEP